MNRLTQTQVAVVRQRLLLQQGGKCAICGLPITGRDVAVLDHHHGTGAVRGTLHRSCNALLGVVENNAPRYGVRDIGTFANGIAAYLLRHMTNITGLMHPTHRTDDEKRELRNKRARVKRASAKKETA